MDLRQLRNFAFVANLRKQKKMDGDAWLFTRTRFHTDCKNILKILEEEIDVQTP